MLGFDWDDGNRAKCQTHGVTIAEIEFVFANEPLVAPDIRHSVAEDRLVAIGANERGRRIFVAFTVRVRDSARLIRPISARFMRDKEFCAMPKTVPHMTTDEEVEAFLEQDLSDLDWSQFRPVHFEFSKKTAQINMRVPEALLTEVKRQSSARGIPYTRFIREAIEQALARRPAGQSGT